MDEQLGLFNEFHSELIKREGQSAENKFAGIRKEHLDLSGDWRHHKRMLLTPPERWPDQRMRARHGPLWNGIEIEEKEKGYFPLPLNPLSVFGINAHKLRGWAVYEENEEICRKMAEGAVRLLPVGVIEPRQDLVKHIYMNLPSPAVLYLLYSVGAFSEDVYYRNAVKRGLAYGVEALVQGAPQAKFPFRHLIPLREYDGMILEKGIANIAKFPENVWEHFRERFFRGYANFSFLDKLREKALGGRPFGGYNGNVVSDIKKEHAGLAYAGFVLRYLRSKGI
jgi:hypothetical protein